MKTSEMLSDFIFCEMHAPVDDFNPYNKEWSALASHLSLDTIQGVACPMIHCENFAVSARKVCNAFANENKLLCAHKTLPQIWEIMRDFHIKWDYYKDKTVCIKYE